VFIATLHREMNVRRFLLKRFLVL